MLSWQIRKRERDGAVENAKEGKHPPLKLSRRATLAKNRQLSTTLRARESALFRPVRAIGMVVDDLPVAQSTLGDADFVVASVRNGFQVFECEHLRLAYIGPRLNEKIRALSTVGETVLTSLEGGDIVAWHKLVELGRFRGHTTPATLMCTVGASFLVSGGGKEVFVWQLSQVGISTNKKQDDVNDLEQSADECVLSPLAQLNVGEDFGEITAACHPPTYLNKVLLASSTGQLQLWNARTKEKVYTFKSIRGKSDKSMAITCLGEVPNVLDLIGVGFADGRICIINAKEDKIVVEFLQTQGRVTAMSFRDGSGAPAQLVTGTPNGALVVWDLERRRAHHVEEGAHIGPVSTVRFLPGQPVFVTSAGDNSIRMWIFDSADGLPRSLRGRSGCPAPARRMSFYGNGDDKELVVGGGSGSLGFVSKVSFIRDQQNKNYEQKALQKMSTALTNMQSLHRAHLPPVVDMSFCEVRHYDWPAVVTAHENMDAAFVWSAEHQALAPKAMKPANVKDCAPVTAVSVSPCGNYCVTGLANGTLHRFNLQSQLHRGPIPQAPRNADKSTKEPKAHLGRVCGVAVSSAGLVISLASHPEDNALKVWKLMTHEPVFSVPLRGKTATGTSAGILLRVQGALAACAMDDGSLQVVDLTSAAVVRTFDCGVPATDVSFGSDGRWLAAALRDGGLRVFDLLAARCVDSFVFTRPALGVCFAPSGAFLLTSHSKGNYLQVWANKYLFDPSLSAPLLNPEPTKPIMIDEPGAPDLDQADDTIEEDTVEKPMSKSETNVAPLGPDLLTLSDVPPGKWQATLHLDTVKERNKPQEPPKPLPNAPFFLPTTHDGVVPRFAQAADDTEQAALDHFSAPAKEECDRTTTKGYRFQVLLRKGSFDKALDFLREQTASGVHLAIEEMGPLAGGDIDELKHGVRFFKHQLEKAHYADEVQAFLSIFLQVHGEELSNDDEMKAECDELRKLLEDRWSALNRQCQKVRCFLGMLTHTQSQW